MASTITRYVDPDAVGANNGTSWEDAYTSLAAWDAAEAEDITSATGSDEIHIVYCRASSNSEDDSTCSLGADWKTSATNYISIIVEQANRHDGTRGTGYRIVVDGAWESCIVVQMGETAYLFIEGVSCKTTNTNNQACVIVVDDVVGIFSDLLTCDAHQAGDGDGIRTPNATNGPTLNNCIAYGNGGIGFETATQTINHCTAINNGADGISVVNWRTTTAKNCYSGANTDGDYVLQGGNATLNTTTCHDSDGTADTTTACSTSEGAYFTNVTAGSENVSIANAASGLIEAGTGGILTYDFEEDERDGSNPDVGADEYVGAAVGYAHSQAVIIG